MIELNLTPSLNQLYMALVSLELQVKVTDDPVRISLCCGDESIDEMAGTGIGGRGGGDIQYQTCVCHSDRACAIIET